MDRFLDNQEPLQMILSMEETVKLTERVTKQLSQGSYSSIQPSILSLASSLKRHGPSMECLHGEHLDRLQLVLRSACRDKKLDLVSRLHLLEMIELRSFNWAPSQHVTNYYKMKLSQIKGDMLGGTKELPRAPASQSSFKPPSSHLNANAPDFHLGTSHLLMNLPHRPTTSSLFSSSINPEPTINIQPPPMRPRQSANYSGDNLGVNLENDKTQAMEKDIKAGSGDSNSQNTTVTIHTKDGDITLTSINTNLLHTFKNILQEQLPMSESSSTSSLASSKPELTYLQPELLSSTSSLASSKPELIYLQAELLELATSPLCRLPPPDWDKIATEIPSIVKIKPIRR